MTERKGVSPEALDTRLLPKQRKPIPHAFVLDAISPLSPYTRPTFGLVAIYVEDKIVLILRDKPKSTADIRWPSRVFSYPNLRLAHLLRKYEDKRTPGDEFCDQQSLNRE